MRSEEEEAQINQAFSAIEQFTKLFVKSYPLAFKNGVYSTKVNPEIDGTFPYEVVLEIKVKE